MFLEIRLNNEFFELHIIDSVSGRPLSIIPKTDITINEMISKLVKEYPISKIYRVKKPLLTKHHTL